MAEQKSLDRQKSIDRQKSLDSGTSEIDENWRAVLLGDDRFSILSEVFSCLFPSRSLDSWLDGLVAHSQWDIEPKPSKVEKFKFRLFYLYPRPVIRAMKTENTHFNVFRLVRLLVETLGFTLEQETERTKIFEKNDGKDTKIQWYFVRTWSSSKVAPRKYNYTPSTREANIRKGKALGKLKQQQKKTHRRLGMIKLPEGTVIRPPHSH